MGVPALRDLSVDDLPRAAELMDDVTFRRVRHIVTENQRVLDTVRTLREHGPSAIGDLLLASHASMRDDFEISVPELDTAVEAAMAAGAVGARMTGGGFGGAAIALVARDRVETVTDAATAAFAASGFAAPTIFTVGRPPAPAATLNALATDAATPGADGGPRSSVVQVPGASEALGRRERRVAFITVGIENSADIKLFYTDQGKGPDGGADPRLPAERRVVGQAAGRPARRGLPGDRLRPTRVRRFEQDARRLGLRHVRVGPQRADAHPRPRDACPRRLLDGHRRGGALPRAATAASASAKAAFVGVARAVPAQDRREPGRRRAAGVLRRHRRRRSARTGTPSSPASSRTSTTSTRTSARASRRRRCRCERADGEPRRQRRDRCRAADLADRLPRRHREDRRADAHRARHGRQHPADRRHRAAASRSCCRTRPTSRSTARRTGCCGPTPPRSTRRCWRSWQRASEAAVSRARAQEAQSPRRASGTSSTIAATTIAVTPIAVVLRLAGESSDREPRQSPRQRECRGDAPAAPPTRCPGRSPRRPRAPPDPTRIAASAHDSGTMPVSHAAMFATVARVTQPRCRPVTPSISSASRNPRSRGAGAAPRGGR